MASEVDIQTTLENYDSFVQSEESMKVLNDVHLYCKGSWSGHRGLCVKLRGKEDITSDMPKVDLCALLLPMYVSAHLVTFSPVLRRDNMAKKWKRRGAIYELQGKKHSQVELLECAVKIFARRVRKAAHFQEKPQLSSRISDSQAVRHGYSSNRLRKSPTRKPCAPAAALQSPSECSCLPVRLKK